MYTKLRGLLPAIPVLLVGALGFSIWNALSDPGFGFERQKHPGTAPSSLRHTLAGAPDQAQAPAIAAGISTPHYSMNGIPQSPHLKTAGIDAKTDVAGIVARYREQPAGADFALAAVLRELSASKSAKASAIVATLTDAELAMVALHSFEDLDPFNPG